MEFLIGFLGALAAMGLLFSGSLIGWKARSAFEKYRTRKTAEELTELEKQRIREEQQAFSALQNYSSERAYGLMKDPLERERGGVT